MDNCSADFELPYGFSSRMSVCILKSPFAFPPPDTYLSLKALHSGGYFLCMFVVSFFFKGRLQSLFHECRAFVTMETYSPAEQLRITYCQTFRDTQCIPQN